MATELQEQIDLLEDEELSEKIKQLDIYEKFTNESMMQIDFGPKEISFEGMTKEQIFQWVIRRHKYSLQKAFIQGTFDYALNHGLPLPNYYYYPTEIFTKEAENIIRRELLAIPRPIKSLPVFYILKNLLDFIDTLPENHILVLFREKNVALKIEEVLNGPIKPLTIEGVKRLLRPTMGRCQGSFCLPSLIEIMSNAYNTAPENIVVRNSNGNIISKGTMYLNKNQGYAVINDFELNDQYRHHEKSEGRYDVEENSKDEKERELIFKAFQRGLKAFTEKYDQKNPSKPIKQINIGMGYNRLKKQVERFKKETSNLTVPAEYSFKDAESMQYILYKKDEKQIEKEGDQR